MVRCPKWSQDKDITALQRGGIPGPAAANLRGHHNWTLIWTEQDRTHSFAQKGHFGDLDWQLIQSNAMPVGIIIDLLIYDINQLSSYQSRQ